MNKRILALFCAMLMMLAVTAGVLPAHAASEQELTVQRLVMQPDGGKVTPEPVLPVRNAGSIKKGAVKQPLKQDAEAEKDAQPAQIVVEGALPADITAEAVHVDPADYLRESQNEILCAYEISLYSGEQEYEPEDTPIQVSISGAEIAASADAGGNLIVVHIPDDPEAPLDLIADYTLDGSTLTFSTERFSVFMIVDVGENGTEDILKTPRAYYYFLGNPTPAGDETFTAQLYGIETDTQARTPVWKQIVKNGDVLNSVPVPSPQDGKNFLGWYYVEKVGDDLPETAEGAQTITFRWHEADQLERAVFGEPVSVGDGEDGKCYYLAPLYENYRILVFHEDDYSVITKKLVVLGNTAGTMRAEALISGVSVTPKTATHTHYGWKFQEQGYGERHVTIVDEMGNAIPATIEITEEKFPNFEIHLQPEFKASHWLNFNTMDSDATFFEPQLIMQNPATGRMTVTSQMLQQKIPVWENHRFDGWYLDQKCTQQLTDETGTLTAAYPNGFDLNEDTMIYARWTYTGGDVAYKYLYWEQLPTDAADLPDSAKHYSFDKAETNTGPAGAGHYTEVPTPEAKAGFHVRMDEPQEVMEDGSTVVNVYYDRDPKTITFHVYGSHYAPTTSNGNNQYGLVNGEYVPLTRSGNNYTYSEYHYNKVSGGRNGTYYIYEDGEYKSQYLYYHDGRYYKERFWILGYIYDDEYTGELFERTTETIRYTDTRYTQTTGWYVYKTLNGLYGQTFEQAGVAWPSEYKWYEGHTNTGTSGTHVTFLDGFTENAVSDYYATTASSGSVPIRFYKQDLDNPNNWILANTIYSSGGNFTFSEKYQGFHLQSARANNGSWQNVSVDETMSYSSSLDVRFTRNKYDILFLDANDDPTQPYRKIENVPFGTDLSQYASTPLPENEPGIKYTGWNFTFANATMPANDLVIYANRETAKYKVKLELDGGAFPENFYQHPPDDENWEWTFSTYFNLTSAPYRIGEYKGVEKTFKESASGEYVYILVDENTPHNDPETGEEMPRYARYVRADDPLAQTYADCLVKNGDGTPKRYKRLDPQDGEYKLEGWYEVDPETGEVSETPFNFLSEVRHDTTLRAVWTNTGAKYTLVYDTVQEFDDGTVVGGSLSGSTTEHNLLEKAAVTVPPAPQNITAGYVFEHWDLNGTVLHPGDSFKIARSMADENLTIRLQAVYAKKEESEHNQKLTDLLLHANDGTDPEHIESLLNLQQNERVDLGEYSNLFHREGYELLGWASEPDAALPEFGTFDHVGADLIATADGRTNHLYAVWRAYPAPTSYRNDALPYAVMLTVAAAALILMITVRRRKGVVVHDDAPI